MSPLHNNFPSSASNCDSSLDYSITLDESNADNNSARFSEDTISPAKAIVSFVIDEPDTGDVENQTEKEKKKCERKEHRKIARHTSSKFLSILYAIILVLIGVVLPVSGALQHHWGTSTVAAVFLMYLCGGSIVVLVYLLIVNKKRPTGHHDDSVNTTTSAISESINPRFSEEDSVFDDDSVAAAKLETSEPPMNRNIPLEQLPTSPTYRNKHFNNVLEQIHGSSPRLSRRGSLQSSVYSPSLNRRLGLPTNGCSPNLGRRGSLPQHILTLTQTPSAATQLTSTPAVNKRRSVLSSLSVVSDDVYDDSVEDEAAHYITLNTQTASLSHEGTSFYLRFGVLLFSVAYMMYLILEIQSYFALRDAESCESTVADIIVVILQLIFVMVQTFFLFKIQNLYITKFKNVIRFGLMHVLATNLVVWIRALVLEIVEGIHEANSEEHDTHHDVLADNTTIITNETECSAPALTNKAMSYLFPSILEYSLIAMATMATRFLALDIRISGEVLQSIEKYLRKARQQDKKGTAEVELQSQHHTKMLDKSHTGLFGGILLFTGTIVAFVIFVYYGQSDSIDEQEDAILIYDITDSTLCVIALVACIVGGLKLRWFRHSFLRDNYIDHLLLLVSLCGLMLYELFQTVCFFFYISHGISTAETLLGAICSILSMLQSLVQTTFVTFGMQCYAHRPEQRVNKPGRGTITFLIITNISFWVLKSFGEKYANGDLLEEFYGITPWQIIMHFSLPFMLFFRFHSSVCLADMWSSAYENEENPVQYVSIE